MEQKLQLEVLKDLTATLSNLGELFETDEEEEDIGFDSGPELIQKKGEGRTTVSTETVTVVLYSMEHMLSKSPESMTSYPHAHSQQRHSKPAASTMRSLYNAMLTSCHCEASSCRAFLVKPYLYRFLPETIDSTLVVDLDLYFTPQFNVSQLWNVFSRMDSDQVPKSTAAVVERLSEADSGGGRSVRAG
eukprot:scaffold5472_cov391-Prasinococcus_capsulatus_cf.AAC.3